LSHANPHLIDVYLAECRDLTLAELRRVVETHAGHTGALHELVLDYPLRDAKALRPALCIASCRALGGPLEGVLPSAAILELYHNAFLLHDDVEDDSENRRGREALHREYGAPIAINVGDAMLALALEPLLENMRLVGLGKAIRILQVVARMARESTEGQALELDWIRHGRWDLRASDYVRMVYKKTSWYTFVAPVLIGGIVAGATARQLVALRKFAALLGIAFQIQDDVLNLTGEGDRYGKEIAGDLWEGKRTLILLHAMHGASPAEQERARAILAKPRPRSHDGATSPSLRARLAERLETLTDAGEISAHARGELAHLLATDAPEEKTTGDIAWLRALVERSGANEYARGVARDYAFKAERAFGEVDGLLPSSHRDFLTGLVRFVTMRDR
jgi:geranylgeranyl diphosphate synthase type II